MSSKNKSISSDIRYVFYRFGHVVLFRDAMFSCNGKGLEMLVSFRNMYGFHTKHDNVFNGLPYTNNLKYYYIIKNGVDNISKL
jgi:hypothetical protein